MLVRDARAVARRWVLEEGRRTPGFVGAYVGGSASWLPADAPSPPTSDLDVYLVLEGAEGAPKPGKFLYHGVLLEVSYVPRDSLRSPEAVLSHYHLAGGFRTPSVILDPTGALTALQEAVGREFARRSWVRRRCEHAAGVVREWAGGLDETAPLHDQVTRTTFAAGVTTHVLLVAGLQNPTVRRRYAASRELLLAYGRPDVQEALLTLLGCAGMSPQRVAHHLSATAAAFDAAKTRIRTPYRFAADISDAARSVAIDGSQELIDRGLHREAVFWIVATFSRCRHIFAADAPELLARTADGYHALLADLDLDSYPARRRRGAAILAYLPTLDEVTETILAANPAIQDDPPPVSAAPARSKCCAAGCAVE
ncbi:MAG TPA: hypothetical protein VH257_05135 [Chloroflexota bacterium]|nr:hypothetical protein [Chloroflexota bacterium]